MSGVRRYQQVKDFILDRIETGQWRPGDRILSEAELVRKLGASRMTVNRAVRELSDQGLLTRRKGSGTFVAAERRPAEVMEVRNIAEQLRDLGQGHSADVIELSRRRAGARLAAIFELSPEDHLYRTVIVHSGDGVPVQLEDRYVNPAVDPDFINADFTRITPSEHLIATAPVFEVEHSLEAVNPDRRARNLLGVAADQACLLLTRKTWTARHVATYARFLHPGHQFKFVSHFSYRQEGTRR